MIHHGLSRKEYDALPGGNPSLLWTLLKSPSLAQAEILSPSADGEASSAQRFGTLAHCFTLEREQFASSTLVTQKTMSKEAKEARAAGKTVILPSTLKKLEQIDAALNAHPLARRMLEASNPEVAVTFERFSRPWKSRLDLLAFEGEWIADIKTCGTIEQLARRVRNGLYGDHFAAAFRVMALEQNGFETPRYFLIGVSKERVPQVAVGVIPRSSIHVGRQEVNQAFHEWIRLEEKPIWPGRYDDRTLTFPLSGYYEGPFLRPITTDQKEFFA